MSSTATAVMTQTFGPVVTRVVAKVYAYLDEYVLEISAERVNLFTHAHEEETRHARYPDFDTAVDQLDTGIFTLTTTQGFALDMYDQRVDAQDKTTTTQSSSTPDDVDYV